MLFLRNVSNLNFFRNLALLPNNLSQIKLSFDLQIFVGYVKLCLSKHIPAKKCMVTMQSILKGGVILLFLLEKQYFYREKSKQATKHEFFSPIFYLIIKLNPDF